MQTNTSVASSLGTYFLPQISLIFLDMLNVYRYCYFVHVYGRPLKIERYIIHNNYLRYHKWFLWLLNVPAECIVSLYQVALLEGGPTHLKRPMLNFYGKVL